MSDLKFIFHYLNFNGDHANVLPQNLQLKFRLLADGFGKIDPSMDQFEDMIWDWSHIRDSSDEAIAKIADSIRKFVIFGVA